jgi:hypothetical protein
MFNQFAFVFIRGFIVWNIDISIQQNGKKVLPLMVVIVIVIVVADVVNCGNILLYVPVLVRWRL